MESDQQHVAWLKKTAGGDEQSMAALYAAFSARVYNTALGYLQNAADAEEVTQDVFLKIFRSADRFEGKSTVSTWVYRITINHSLDRVAYRNRQKRFGKIVRLFGGETNEAPMDLPHFDHPGVVLEQKENARILFSAVESLPVQQKTAFMLSYLENLPRQEVADIMQLSLKAVESLLQRAKVNLRDRLDKFYPDRRK